MQKCPLCHTEYNDAAQVCPLTHCSNCGSLNLQSYKKRSFQSTRAKHNFIFILPPLGFFVLVYGYLFVQGELISFLSIVAVYCAFFLGVLFKITLRNINCQDCKAKNFPSVKDINLNPIKRDTSIDDKDLTKKIAKTVLDGLAKEQKRHNKQDMIIRIIGAISLITIATLGTFFVNPDDVLLGKIIEMIQSLK
ncbi:MAG: hypothetical protein R3237_01405 [Nitrosopumilaceae archaeon]|nr:hypothetical protein [Nitrosopumilaceae archaeon]